MGNTEEDKEMTLFERERLEIKPLSERRHDIDIGIIKQLSHSIVSNSNIREVAEHVISAIEVGSEVILIIGGHVIRSGVQRFLIDLMEGGYITCMVMNGSGIIHDYELALVGATTESVAIYIKEGQFGLWQETGRLNDIINDAYNEDKSIGMGEAVGRAIYEGSFPNKDTSILAACYRLNVPVTAHVGIGYDIIHEHPNCNGAATGALSYNDFLRFASVVENLDKGVVMNFGSSVMGPEVFLKALSMARNVVRQRGQNINNFTTLVCDLHDLPEDFSREPDKDDPSYYFRPWKTMLVRTIADGGRSYYVKGRHAETIPGLWTAIKESEKIDVNQGLQR